MKENRTGTHKERGGLLSFILVVMAVHGIFATILYYAIRTQEALDRPWIISLMVLHSLVNIIAAAGIWYWKKWALYICSFNRSCYFCWAGFSRYMVYLLHVPSICHSRMGSKIEMGVF